MPSMPASWVVNTSIPRRWRPCVTARGICSSIYQRTTLATAVFCQFRGRALLHTLNYCTSRANACLYLLPMIVIVCQGSVDLGECQVIICCDLVRTHPHMLMPNRDILHADAPSSN